MTIFIQRASQTYSARPGNPYKISATIPAQAVIDSVKITLTREGWPSGPVGDVSLVGPDGSIGGASFSGGDIAKRDGTGVLATSTCEFSRSGADGADLPFSPGSYTLSFNALQAVTTALTVEYF